MLERSRNYALYQLESYANCIRDKYLSEKTLQKEELAFTRFAKEIQSIINDTDFNQSFYRYAIADKKCDGSTAVPAQGQTAGVSTLDPVHFLQSDRVDQIILAAFAALMYEPSEVLIEQFYKNTILPAELKLADSLDADELKEIKNIFMDSAFSEQFLSGCTPTQKKTLLAEIDEAIKPLTDENALVILSKENPILKKAIEDAESENAVWNWIKDSGQDIIDKVLGVFAPFRESWAIKDFGKAPALKNSLRTGIRRSLIGLRIGTASFKKCKAASVGTVRKVALRSGKLYIGSVKTRMCDPNRWIKNDDGKILESTPANFNMMFSAIGIIVSIQGIYSFSQKCKGDSKPEIDDYVDLYKSLSSGVSSVTTLMPEAVNNSSITKALSTVFKPLSVACDLHSAYKLIAKSQLYFAHGDMNTSLYAGIQGGIKAVTAGFNIATLFRFKWMTKFLLRGTPLVGLGSRAIPIIGWALVGVDAFKWSLSLIEPDALKHTKKNILPELDKLINVPMNKNSTKIETIKIEKDGLTFNVPKIQNYDPDLSWVDSMQLKDKGIEPDKNRKWDWQMLRMLINDEMIGVPLSLKGLGWVTQFDEDKAMFELLERGVMVDDVAVVCKRSKEEVESTYLKKVQSQHAKIGNTKDLIRDAAKKLENLNQALS